MATSADNTKKKKDEEVNTFADFVAKNRQAIANYTPKKAQDDDIAPVGEKQWHEKIFQAGAFEDGYQAWDGVKTVLGTVGDAAAGIGKGFFRTIEGMSDLGLYGVAGAADLFGADEIAGYVKKVAMQDSTSDLFAGSDKFLDENSVLGDTSDSVMEGLGQVATMLAGGYAGGAAGLGKIGQTILSTGITGASAAGGGMSEAYQGGATDAEAAEYGFMKGAIEAGTEMLFAGLGKVVNAVGISKGLVPLDDMLAKKLSSKISNRLASNMVQYGVKASAEGAEEFIAGVGSAFAKKLTYMNEEDLEQLLADESLLESFVVGTITSGITQSGIVPGMKKGSLIESVKEDYDFVSGLTANEQKVVDKVVNDLVGDKKLTNKEKSKIYDSVVEDLENGNISTDVIEEVLFGEDYKAYKDTSVREKSLSKELQELRQMKSSEMNDIQRDRLAELKGMDLKTSGGLKSQVEQKTRDMLSKERNGKGSYLMESYNERARTGQAFEADVTKYSEKQREVVQKAIDKGFLNNTRKMHNAVDLVAKVYEDTGLSFDFTSNAKLADSGMDLDGKRVNGYVDENGNIYLNVNSAKVLNTIVGHEVTHTLEKAKGYDQLAAFLKANAKDYDSRLSKAKELYKGVYKDDLDAKAEKEVVADLVGDYLFTDADFVRQLSTTDRNLFQKIYDEIKHLCKLATAGSKEARELEKAKKMYADIYRELGKQTEAKGETKFSISEATDTDYLSAVERGDTDTAQKMVDEAAKEAGYTIKAYHGTNADFTVFDKNRIGKGIDQYGSGFYFASNPDVTESYGTQRYDTYLNIQKPIRLISKPRGEGKTLYDVRVTQSQAYQILKQHPLMYDAENSPLGDFYEEYWDVGVKDWMIRDLAKKYDSIGKLDGDVILYRDYPNELHEAIRDVLGYDGVVVYFETDKMVDDRNDYYYVAWFDNQMKSSVPVTYDADGNVIPLSQRFKSENNDIRYSLSDGTYADTFYSQMAKVVDGVKQEKLGASSVVSMLRGKGVKAEEIKWSGIEAWLEGKKSVTKQELQEFIAGSQLQIEEETNETTNDEYYRQKFEELKQDREDDPIYLLDGEEVRFDDALYEAERRADRQGYIDDDVRCEESPDGNGWSFYINGEDGEVIDLFTIDKAEFDYSEEAYREWVAEESKYDIPHIDSTKWGEYKLDNGSNYRELLFKLPDSDYSNGSMRMHWGDDAGGVLAHARIQDLDTDYGDKMLFIEEIQSDWHNEGQKQGYEIGDEEFAEARRRYNDLEREKERLWEEYQKHDVTNLSDEESLALSSDYVAKVNVLDNETESLLQKYGKSITSDAKDLVPDAPFRNNYHEFVLKRLIREAAEKGYDSIGWTTADIQSERWSDEYAEGYRIEYDQDIPSFLKKYGKKWGATVGKTTIDGTTVWEMDIPEAMKQSVLYEGQPLYSLSEDGTPATQDYILQEIERVGAEREAMQNEAEQLNRDAHAGVITWEEYRERIAGFSKRWDELAAEWEKLMDAVEVPTKAETDPYAPMTEDEANAWFDEADEYAGYPDVPVDAPYIDPEDVAPVSPFESRDIKAVGNQKVKAYMYENPEVKPFFQKEAEVMLGELERTTKGERLFDDEVYYETNGEAGISGTSRQTTADIAYLLDNGKGNGNGYSYAEIEKGLKAIIEDNGAENNACSKRIEFLLNDRLMNGHEDIDGMEIPANQDYLNLLAEKQITEYSKEAREKVFAEPAVAPEPVKAESEDIGPVKAKPKKAEKDTSGKQRSWAKTATESEVVNRAILPEDLEQDAITYQPIPNKVTLNKANAKLDRLGYEQSVEYFNGQLESKKTTLEDIALGERLIQEAMKRGDTKLAGELIQNVAILGTELGQKVQALSIIQRMTPEGQLKMLQKTVNRGKAKGDKAYEGVEITQEIIDKILGTYNKASDADVARLQSEIAKLDGVRLIRTDAFYVDGDTYRHRNKLKELGFKWDADKKAWYLSDVSGTFDQQKLTEAVEDAKHKIAEQMNVSKMDKVNAWRYLSMLGNPKTHIRNIVSNVAMKGTLAVKNAVARTVEDIAPVKNRTKTWKRVTADVKAFAEQTAQEMKDVISDGGKYSEDASVKAKRRTFKSKILNGVYEFNNNMLSKEDWWFSKSAFTNALSEFLTANGISTNEDIAKNPELIAKAKAYATEQSQIATFRQYSWLANEINRIERKNTATQIAVGAVLPFKKTPINIAKTGLSYSPLGFAKTLTYDIAQVKKGNMDASELIDHLSQNLTGTALTLVGYMLACSGFLNGAGEDDKEGNYDYQLGEQAYSITIGGDTYSLSWLSPVSMPLFVGANAYEQLTEGKEWNGDVVVQTLAQTLDPLSEMSFLSSLDSVLSSYDSGFEKFAGIGEAMVQNYATQFVPTLSSQIAAVSDDKKRTTKVGADSSFKLWDETINNLKYKIPGLRQTLEPTTDVWGNEVKQSENIVEKAVDNFIAPYSRRENIATAIDGEIKDLYSRTGEDGIIPNIPGNTVTYDGEKHEMSAAEHTAYKKTYGQTANDLLEELFESTMYKNASAEERADYIQEVYDYARDKAKYEYLRKKGVEYSFEENSIKGAIENDMPPDEYEFSLEQPQQYSVSRAVGGYDAYKQYSTSLNDIEADKDANGKTVAGSRKAKVIEYLNGLDADYGVKLILFKSEYTADDTYNREIVNYLNGRDDISYEEMASILTALGFTVSSNGSISW